MVDRDRLSLDPAERPQDGPPSLAGRRIAVTRPAGERDALADAILALGGEVLRVPALAFAPPASWASLDEALASLVRFDAVAFASARAVDAALDRAAALGVAPAVLARPLLAVVGGATAARLAARLRPPDLVPTEATGAALAAALGDRLHGKSVLVPRAAEGRPELVDGLRAAGVRVTAPEAYRTVPAGARALAPLDAALRARAVHAVTFASPSAVRAVAAALSPPGLAALAATPLAALGPTTAAALRAANLVVSVEGDPARGGAGWPTPWPPTSAPGPIRERFGCLASPGPAARGGTRFPSPPAMPGRYAPRAHDRRGAV